MKKSDRIKKEAEDIMNKIRGITRHIRNVEDNCFILGEKLIMLGEINLGKQLIANGFVHDASKFHGIEFEYMAPGVSVNNEGAKLKLKIAIHHHQTTNLHHVEAWSGGIKDMPDVYLAELVCDIKARSEEFGTSLLDYIENEGIKRWDITKEDEIYIKMMKFVNLLCNKPFEKL
jgi:hypothetical protein